MSCEITNITPDQCAKIKQVQTTINITKPPKSVCNSRSLTLITCHWTGVRGETSKLQLELSDYTRTIKNHSVPGRQCGIWHISAFLQQSTIGPRYSSLLPWKWRRPCRDSIKLYNRCGIVVLYRNVQLNKTNQITLYNWPKPIKSLCTTEQNQSNHFVLKTWLFLGQRLTAWLKRLPMRFQYDMYH